MMITFCILIFSVEGKSQQSLSGRFGFGLGYQTGLNFVDFNLINSKFLKQNENGLSENLMINGFTSYLYFLILPNTRITLDILSGKKAVQTSPGRFLSFEKSFWGIGFDYTFSIYFLNISPGFSFGKQTNLIELTDFNGNTNFQDILQQFNSQNFTSSMINFENNSYHISPSIDIEFSTSRFTTLRINYIYQIQLINDWKFLGRFKADNIPGNLLRSNHFICLGILIGFMSK